MNKQRVDKGQMAIRGKGGSIGFLVMGFWLAISPIIGIFYGKPLFTSQAALSFFTALMGVSVVYVYLIVKSAFIQVKERKRLILHSLIYLIVGIFWLKLRFADLSQIIVNGQVTEHIMPLFGFLLVFTGLYLAYEAIKKR